MRQPFVLIVFSKIKTFFNRNLDTYEDPKSNNDQFVNFIK